MMSLRVLVASSSAYRLWWYVDQLQSQGIEVIAAVNGIVCVEQMRNHRPDVVLLDPSLLWGGSLGVLAVRSEEPDLQRIPVVLMGAEGVSTEWYELAGYPVQGLLLRDSSGKKLVAILEAASQESCAACQK